jgi:hypothetical protein
MITSFNIERLLNKCSIVLVVSNEDEREYYQKYPITVVLHPNFPLGAKWQFGVDQVSNDDLIILGSDDLLSDNYIDVCQDFIEEKNFIGLKQWYIHHKGKAYHCEYLSYQSLGGGRCYSKKLLKQMDNQLFNRTFNKCLDDHGFRLATRFGYHCFCPETVSIHAIKGDWPVINPVNLNHRNVKLIATYDSATILPELYR